MPRYGFEMRIATYALVGAAIFGWLIWAAVASPFLWDAFRLQRPLVEPMLAGFGIPILMIGITIIGPRWFRRRGHESWAFWAGVALLVVVIASLKLFVFP